MVNYTSGYTYRRNYIDTDKELVPQNAAFSAIPDEVHFFEEREGSVSYYQIMCALEKGTITKLDKTIISLVALFGSCCCTTRVLREMLLLMNNNVSETMFKSSLNRLHRYQLINFSRFQSGQHEPSKFKIITLTNYGSQLAKSLGVIHRFNPMANASAPAYVIKARAQISQLLCNYLKNVYIDSFRVRPVVVVNVDEGAIVRPALSISIDNEIIDFEVIRRHEGWQEDLIDKLHRYELVFKDKLFPVIVINGEDEAMNCELADAIKDYAYYDNILYTDDLAMFGPNFKYSLYRFDKDGNKQCFKMNALRKQGGIDYV